MDSFIPWTYLECSQSFWTSCVDCSRLKLSKTNWYILALISAIENCNYLGPLANWSWFYGNICLWKTSFCKKKCAGISTNQKGAFLNLFGNFAGLWCPNNQLKTDLFLLNLTNQTLGVSSIDRLYPDLSIGTIFSEIVQGWSHNDLLKKWTSLPVFKMFISSPEK